MSIVLPTMTSAEALAIANIHRVADHTAECTAFITTCAKPHDLGCGSDRLCMSADDPCIFTAGD
ncbi:MAG TPA: hypothetical protein VLK82_02690 [Candidatus Tectomicrobia bacterium]|nr:hypothetical protein [Candidatus Tectomicrobia bacterium]